MTFRCDLCRREYDVRPAPSCPACYGRLSIVDALPLEDGESDCALAACGVLVAELVVDSPGAAEAPTEAPDMSGGGGESGGGGASGYD